MPVDAAKVEVNSEVRTINEIAEGLPEEERYRFYHSIANLMGSTIVDSVTDGLRSAVVAMGGPPPNKPTQKYPTAIEITDYFHEKAEKYKGK